MENKIETLDLAFLGRIQPHLSYSNPYFLHALVKPCMMYRIICRQILKTLV